MKRFFAGLRAIPKAIIGGLLLITYYTQNSARLMRYTMRRFFQRLFDGLRAIPEAIIGGLLLILCYARNSERLMRILWRFVYRLRTNNNTRANTLLLLVAAFGLFWLVFFGITPATPGMDAEDIAFYSAAGENTPWLSYWGFGEQFKWAVWKIWWWLLAIAISYRIFAWRDEVHRAWERTRQHMAEVREAIKDLSPGQVLPDGTRLEHPVGMGAWIRVFFRELTAASIGDTVVGAILRK